MDADLLTVARTLAERGWLPGICDHAIGEWNPWSRKLITTKGVYREMKNLEATEADLHLAAHNEIVRRGWDMAVLTAPNDDRVKVYWSDDGDEPTEQPGTTTLSLLRCLLAACEESEKETPNGP